MKTSGHTSSSISDDPASNACARNAYWPGSYVLCTPTTVVSEIFGESACTAGLTATSEAAAKATAATAEESRMSDPFAEHRESNDA
ncbi:hypothetical protein [Fodinicola feengrottensis]|uniref:hypothetical protein n=1 Tax=Fodinicola feengrottensis TaxID=435914 RepID=UPI0024426AD3|nr:hypothetical protein [Fodinicola feengrottensis]